MGKLRNDCHLNLLNLASKQLRMTGNNFLKIILLTGLIFTSCDTTEPELLDYHNKILFTSSRSGKAQLYMMNPDGTNIKQITNGNYSHGNGRWSPDAQKILCNTEEGSSTAGASMVVMNSDGSSRKLLGYGNQMSWSPDGNKITFIYMPLAELGFRFRFIYTINTDATDREQVTNDSLEIISSPCWSKDSDKIYFASNRYNVTQMNPEIYSIDIETKEIKRITFTENGYSTSPSVSPLGNQIAFISTWSGLSKAAVFTMNVDGTNVKLITHTPQDEVFNFPRWSLDCKYLIVISGVTDGSARRYIYKINTTNGEYKKLLTDDSTVGYPDWSK